MDLHRVRGQGFKRKRGQAPFVRSRVVPLEEKQVRQKVPDPFSPLGDTPLNCQLCAIALLLVRSLVARRDAEERL